MTNPTRYPGGVSHYAPGDIGSMIAGMALSRDVAVFEEHFLRAATPYGGTHTQTNGTLGLLSPAGIVTQTLGGADNDLSQLYVNANSVHFQSGKAFGWETRVKVTTGANAGQEVFFVGIAGVQTGTNFMAADGSVRTFDRGCGFISYDGAATFDILQGNGDTFSTGGLALPYTTDTWMRLGFVYDGNSTTFYKDGVRIGTLTGNIPAAGCTPLMLYIEAGEAAAKVLSTDYVVCGMEL